MGIFMSYFLVALGFSLAFAIAVCLTVFVLRLFDEFFF